MIEVVIPVYNRRAITLRCLELLSQQANVEFRTTIVDDGSTDGTSEAIRERFPGVNLLRGDGSLWWAGATNLGIRHALQRDLPASHILMLNDDVEFDANYLACMERHALANPGCLIGSLAVYAKDPNRVFWCGEGASYRQRRYGYVRRDGLTGCFPATALPGRGMLVSTAVFTDIGLFDEKNFPQYAADFDFSLRARNAGYKLLCCCDTAVAVNASKTGPGSGYRTDSLGVFLSSFWNLRSPNYLPVLWRFWTKHYGVMRFGQQVSRMVIGEFLRRTKLRRTELEGSREI